MKVKLEDDGEDNSELIEEIEDSFIEEYIPLPGQYEIDGTAIQANLKIRKSLRYFGIFMIIIPTKYMKEQLLKALK